jgi:nucleoid-associated protein YgaU
MIRVLVMIAVTGFLVSVVTLSTAAALGGPEAIARGAWSWSPGHGWAGRHGWDDDDSGPQASREIAWTGGDTLEVEVPAEIRYVQSAGPPKLTISGPRRAVEQVVVENGHIRFTEGRHRHRWGRLTIEMTAPDVKRFDLQGQDRLTIEGYDQDRLALDLTGSAEVTAAGRTKDLALDIAGSADADLSKLEAERAEVDISGSGEAIIAPRDRAKLDISGSGEVTLLTRPAQLEADVSGSGRVHQAEATPAQPAPPATAKR